MRTAATLPTDRVETAFDAARDRIVPAIRTAEGVLVPAVLTAADTAREKTLELLSSDAAHEVRRRGRGVVSAIRGEAGAGFTPAPRRMRYALFFVAGSAVGLGIAAVSKRLATPVPAEYTAPTGTGGLPASDAGEYVRTIPDVDLTATTTRDDLSTVTPS